MSLKPGVLSFSSPCHPITAPYPHHARAPAVTSPRETTASEPHPLSHAVPGASSTDTTTGARPAVPTGRGRSGRFHFYSLQRLLAEPETKSSPGKYLLCSSVPPGSQMKEAKENGMCALGKIGQEGSQMFHPAVPCPASHSPGTVLAHPHGDAAKAP